MSQLPCLPILIIINATLVQSEIQHRVVAHHRRAWSCAMWFETTKVRELQGVVDSVVLPIPISDSVQY